MQFSRYIGIDYSGAETLTSRPFDTKQYCPELPVFDLRGHKLVTSPPAQNSRLKGQTME